MNLHKRGHRPLSALAAILYFAFAQPAAADGGKSAPNDPGSLGARWWQLIMSIPTSVNPFFDSTGELCTIGQQGPTWFLYSSSVGPIGDPVELECTIPEGRPTLVALYVVLCNPFPGETLAENVVLCREAADAADILRVRIDGVVRNDLIKRRARSSPFAITVSDENVFGFPAGIYESVHDGHFALIPPLPRGTHVVRVQGGSTVDGFEFDTRYRLHIVKPAKQVPLP